MLAYVKKGSENNVLALTIEGMKEYQAQKG